MADFTARNHRVAMTVPELAALEQLVKSGDRAGFYLAYYGMTDSAEAVMQPKIATFSGLVGGSAFAANRFLQDQYRSDPTYPYPGIYYLSQKVAESAYNAITADAGDRGAGTGKIIENDFATRSGVPLNLVQRWLGHASTTTLSKLFALLVNAATLSTLIYSPLAFADAARPFKTGEELARVLVSDANLHYGDLDLSKYAHKTCFIPEGAIYPPAYVSRLLPGFEVVFLETTQTDGYWFLVLGSEKKMAWIFAIRQSALRWRVPESASAAEFARCTSRIRVLITDRTPAVELN